MSRLMHNKEESAARLKEIMTVPAMSAERHPLILRQRNHLRRIVEDARELRQHRHADAGHFA